MRNAMNQKRKRKLERELRDERAKERQWKVCVCIYICIHILTCTYVNSSVSSEMNVLTSFSGKKKISKGYEHQVEDDRA
jgi:hypothetical protein